MLELDLYLMHDIWPYRQGKDTYCNKDMCQASKQPTTNLGYDISFSEELLQNYMAVKQREIVRVKVVFA